MGFSLDEQPGRRDEERREREVYSAGEEKRRDAAAMGASGKVEARWVVLAAVVLRLASGSRAHTFGEKSTTGERARYKTC